MANSISPRTSVCVVGAGWYGIAAAKTYLQVDPTISLTVLESSSSLGGTWSRTRTHPDLTTQQPYGAYEYTDLSLPTEGVDNPDDTFIPSQKLHEYMVAFSEKFGIADKIRYDATVTKIGRAGKQWDVFIGEERLRFDKVIMATGLTSIPIIPQIPTDSFTPPVFHSREVGAHYSWLTSPEVSRVTIYGGGKSATDAVYLCAKHGKQVDWVIRPDTEGGGSAGLFPPRLLGQSSNDALTSRFAAVQHPSLDTIGTRAWKLVHSRNNALMRSVHWWWWGMLCRKMVKYGEYQKSENMKKLEPAVKDRFGFWAPIPLALVTQPELMPMIHSGKYITVHRACITSLSHSTAILSDSTSLPTDAVILCTGYHHHPELSSPPSLGLPTPVSSYPSDLSAHWASLEAAAEPEILRLFPRLKETPKVNEHVETHTPYRLFRRIVPVECVEHNDRTFAVVGAVVVVGCGIMAEAQALWAVAWLTDNMDISASREEMERDIAMRRSFARRRYTPIFGGDGTAMLYEYLFTIDALLSELGIETNRKRGKGWVKEFFDPHAPADYRGVVEEWMAKKGLLSS